MRYDSVNALASPRPQEQTMTSDTNFTSRPARYSRISYSEKSPNRQTTGRDSRSVMSVGLESAVEVIIICNVLATPELEELLGNKA